MYPRSGGYAAARQPQPPQHHRSLNAPPQQQQPHAQEEPVWMAVAQVGSSSGGEGLSPSLQRRLAQLQREVEGVLAHMRHVATFHLLLQAQEEEEERRAEVKEEEEERIEAEEEQQKETRRPRLPSIGIPPQPHAPLLPLQPLRQLLQDIQQLHADLTHLSPPLQGRLLSSPTALDFSHYPHAKAALAACPLPRPLALPTHLVLPIATRFLLQYVPLLPSLLGLMCGSQGGGGGTPHSHPFRTLPVQEPSLSLPALDAALFDQALVDLLLGVLEQLFLFLSEAEMAQPNMARILPPMLKTQPRPPSFPIFTWLSLCLQSLDEKITVELCGRQTPISASYSLPSPSTPQLPLLLRMLRHYLATLRDFVSQSSNVRVQPLPTTASPASSAHITLHQRMCAALLSEFKQYEEERQPGAQQDTNGHSPISLDRCLLPPSFFWLVAQLLEGERPLSSAARPADPSSPSSHTVAPQLIQLLDSLLPHISTNYAAYRRKQQEWEEQQQAGCGAEEQQLPAVPSSAATSYSFTDGLSYLLHLLHLHSSSLLSSLSIPARVSLFVLHPLLFEVSLLDALTSVARECSDLGSAHRWPLILEEKLSGVLGMVKRAGEEQKRAPSAGIATTSPGVGSPFANRITSPSSASSGSPVPAAAVRQLSPSLSPYLSLCPPSSPLPSASLSSPSPSSPATSSFLTAALIWHHHSPLGLYQHALSLLEQVCIDSDSQVSVAALHWLQCAWVSRVKQAAEGCAGDATGLLRQDALTAALQQPCSAQQLEVIAQHMGTVLHQKEEQEEKDATSSSNLGGSMVFRHRCWLLLCKYLHWIDYSFFLYSLPSLPPSIERIVLSLLSFHLCPEDMHLCEEVRISLSSARQRCLSGQARGDVEQILSVLEELAAWRQKPNGARLYLRLCCYLACFLTTVELAQPWTKQVSPPTTDSAAAASASTSASPSEWYRLVWMELFATMQRWSCGAMLAATAPPSQLGPPPSSSSVPSPAPSSSLPLSYSGSLGLTHVLIQLQRLQSADMRPHRDSAKLATNKLHRRLHTIFLWKRATEKE